MPASISAIVRTFPHPAPAKGSSLIHLGFSPEPSKQGTLYLRASSMADHPAPDAVIKAERDEDCSRICPLQTIALPSQHRMTRRALRTADSLYATALYACCPAHLALAAIAAKASMKRPIPIPCGAAAFQARPSGTAPGTSSLAIHCFRRRHRGRRASRPKALTDQEIKGIINGYCFMLSCSRAV